MTNEVWRADIQVSVVNCTLAMVVVTLQMNGMSHNATMHEGGPQEPLVQIEKNQGQGHAKLVCVKSLESR